MSKAKRPSPPKRNTVDIPIEHLSVGAVCRYPLEDEDGKLLLGAGTAITGDLIDGLRARGITELTVHADDVASISGKPAAPRGAPKRAAPNRQRVADFVPQDPSKWIKGIPLKDNLVNRHGEPLSPTRSESLRNHVKDAREKFEEIRLDETERKYQTVDALSELSGAFASSMVNDHDQTIGEVISAGETVSLTDRCVKLGVLGMAVGTEMGLDGPSILEIGTAGLLHDIGLYTMDPALTVQGRGPLNEEETWEYRKHPIHSANSLRDVSTLSHSVFTAIEQVHEQFDGSGYPFGIEGKRCNVYARILNVCDTYLRLTHGTSFRHALVPHDALGVLLHQARFCVFDPDVIRAFLRVESLFPLGSRVKLEDGGIADVIRRPLDGYAKPVLQLEDGQMIDLELESGMSLQPVCDPSRNQERISQSFMAHMKWSPADELLLDSA